MIGRDHAFTSIRVRYGRGIFDLNELGKKFGVKRKTLWNRWNIIGRPKKVYKWLFTNDRKEWFEIAKLFRQGRGKEVYFSGGLPPDDEDNDMPTRPVEHQGSGDHSDYQLKPIVLPDTMTEADMKPYRALANAVLASAFEDLVPARPRNVASEKTEQANSALSVSSAFRFLSGESKTDRLGLWCSLSGIPAWKVKHAVKDKEEIVKRLRSILKDTGRGRKRAAQGCVVRQESKIKQRRA